MEEKTEDNKLLDLASYLKLEAVDIEFKKLALMSFLGVPFSLNELITFDSKMTIDEYVDSHYWIDSILQNKYDIDSDYVVLTKDEFYNRIDVFYRKSYVKHICKGVTMYIY